MFEANYQQVAQSLIGKMVKIGRAGEEVEILHAEGYGRRENDKPPYTPVIEMQPGQVFCPKHRSSLLFLVACYDNGVPGGCVLIRKMRKNGQIITGPGRVAEAFGIREPGTFGGFRELGDGTISFRVGL